MKTQISQMLTIVVFFSLAMMSTLTVSWAMTALLNPTNDMTKESVNVIILNHNKIKAEIDFKEAFKLLIPKI
ncbi:MAG: hypothetical protein L3J53_02260 [Proteobacteria bacterium]|nr:hypothetical protein [Pseudomonadota bacterium]